MTPRLFRKRYIPDEIVELKDTIVRVDEAAGLVITRWMPIHPRDDFAAGRSCVFTRRGFKVSALYDAAGRFLRWYCDIVHTEYEAGENAYVFRDLLADVVVSADGRARVLDLGELSQAYAARLISEEDLHRALNALDDLLAVIDEGRFHELAAFLE